MADIYYEEKDFKNSTDYYEKAYKENPLSSNLHLKCGSVFEKQKMFQDAIRQYGYALAKSQKNPS